MRAARQREKKPRRKTYSEKTLLRFVKEHLSNEYPNPEREGCPPKAVLKSLAKEPHASDAAIVYHVFHCSPCYKTCSDFIALLKAEQMTSANPAQERNGSRPRAQEKVIIRPHICRFFCLFIVKGNSRKILPRS